MSTVSIRKALESRLAALLPVLDSNTAERNNGIAYENSPFTPVNGTPYQEVFLLPAQPDNGQMGSKNYIEVGLLQVNLCYPLGTGPAAAQARAELVKTHFKRGTTMVQDNINVIVIRTPQVSPGFRRDDRYIIPVSIYYQAHISL
jgi:hypothetical protein